MKKKGFTLIEIVIAMGLVFLMVGIVNSLLNSYVKSYKNSVVQNNGFNYLNEAISIIEKELNQHSASVKTENNVIKINYFDGEKINNIKCINSNLYILYGTKYAPPLDKGTKSVIIDDVKEFVAIKEGKIIYIKVAWYNGQSIERCLVIENAN
ncbi:type II secretion system GspH family protein [Clostridium algoriphilum]|uniref:type II secretion system protein n=1 Tax=Clostridium algoriphilum TaxID=198347 RepID=UPI001CF1F344|nr:type II secretion system protein [Clostridium algoriphilum]MCB2291976.1 type II secretion system GspH family protein [Clostridium algoriphilum]